MAIGNLKKKKERVVLPRDLWRTPQWLFDGLNREFRFKLDAAADLENRLCDHFWSNEPGYNAFENEWDDPTFCNPPYSVSAGGTMAWVERGYEMSQKHCVPVVFLVQGDTSTKYRKFAMKYGSEIRDLAQRVRFVGAPGTPPWPSAIYVFRPVKHRMIGGAHVTIWDYKE